MINKKYFFVLLVLSLFILPSLHADLTTDFYCVWAKDKSFEKQEKTDRHEYCHYLINNDYNHFCEGVVKK